MTGGVTNDKFKGYGGVLQNNQVSNGNDSTKPPTLTGSGPIGGGTSFLRGGTGKYSSNEDLNKAQTGNGSGSLVMPNPGSQVTKYTPKAETNYNEKVVDQLGDQYVAVRDKLAQNVEQPQLAEGAVQKAEHMTEKANETLDPKDFQIKEIAKVEYSAMSAAQMQMATAEQMYTDEMAKNGVVQQTTAAQMEAAKAQFAQTTAQAQSQFNQLVEAATATAANAEAAYQDLNAVDPRATVTAVTANMPENATVKWNLEQLLDGLDSGNIPTWAKPAIAEAEAQLSARGLSTSSVGKNALYNAIISSATPIAQADAKSRLSVFQQNLSNQQQAALANAQFFQTLTLKNLDNKQQAAMLNATNLTNVSIANAQNATQASIENAKNFLQVDLTKMNNAQQAMMLDSQNRQQTLLNNASFENTARQFNAQNQQQADQFNTQLAASIAQFNATQRQAASQFNANAENTMAQFNAQLQFNRDQFNTQNATAIAQSNVTWRRDINKINTAADNAVNQANAMNMFNLSNQALSFLWQEQRDYAKWLHDGAQNDEERTTQLAIAAMNAENIKDAKTLANIKSLASFAASMYDSWTRGGG